MTKPTSSLLSGGGDDPKPLTPQQRQEWNNYVDWLEKKGYKGSPLLDKKETGLATGLFNQFKKENPNVTLSLAFMYMTWLRQYHHGQKQYFYYACRMLSRPRRNSLVPSELGWRRRVLPPGPIRLF